MPPGEPSDGQDNREPDLAGNRHVQGPGGIRPRVEPPERAQDGQPVRHGPAAAVPPPRGTARRTAPRGTPPRGRSEQPSASRRPSFPEQLSPRGILPLAGLQRQQRGDQNDHGHEVFYHFHIFSRCPHSIPHVKAHSHNLVALLRNCSDATRRGRRGYFARWADRSRGSRSFPVSFTPRLSVSFIS